MNREF